MNKVITEKINTQSLRLQSLDALRGFDMFWIISGEGIFHGLANVVMSKHSLIRNATDYRIATNSSVSLPEKIVVGISNQLHHTPWNGFTFYDMIFPLFIFIAGVSMPYSYGKRLSADATTNTAARRNIYKRLIRRTLVLLFLGMIVNGLLKWQGYENTRFASVLGRIGLSLFFAAVIYLKGSRKAQITWAVMLLLGYWAAMKWIPIPHFGAGVLTPEGNLAGYVDRILLPGKLHRTVYDPEGILATVPAIVTALLGVFTGEFLKGKRPGITATQKGIILVISGFILLGIARLWNLAFPINKNMWTSSFVLYAGGWSILLFAVFYLLIDVAGLKKWSSPFVWIGTNSILIYLAAHGFVNFEATAIFLFGGFINFAATVWQPVWLAVGIALVQLVLLYFLYQKKWFLKL